MLWLPRSLELDIRVFVMALTGINRCQHVVARPGCACCTTEVRALTRRVNTDLSRRGFMASGAASVALLGIAAYTASNAQAVEPKKVTLFTNVRLFDGLALNIRNGVSVLVVDGMIADVAQGPLSAPDGATVIDGGERTLMPGLIDAHWHTMLASLPIPQMLSADAGDIHFAAAKQAERTLMRGFTTVRDAGGPSFPLKRAIDSGSVIGPRIYPSGAMISQTSGHGDFRAIWELPRVGGDLQRGEQLGASRIADGRDAVIQATREQLMLGASQIKIVAGGGASSNYDPLDVLQYFPEEIEAAVFAAADWGTYVCAHVYTPRGIQRCLDAGVRSIEHGHLTDEESVMRIADAGAVWSIQPFVAEVRPDAGSRRSRRCKGAPALDRHRHRLHACGQAQGAHGVRHGHPVRRRLVRNAGHEPFLLDALVHSRSGAGAGNLAERLHLGDVRSAQSISRRDRSDPEGRSCRHDPV